MKEKGHSADTPSSQQAQVPEEPVTLDCNAEDNKAISTRQEDDLPEGVIRDAEEFEVESIIESRKFQIRRRVTTKFRVRWVGYGPEDDTWQTLVDLKNAAEAL